MNTTTLYDLPKDMLIKLMMHVQEYAAEEIERLQRELDRLNKCISFCGECDTFANYMASCVDCGKNICYKCSIICEMCGDNDICGSCYDSGGAECKDCRNEV